jgi:hypothetical protein
VVFRGGAGFSHLEARMTQGSHKDKAGITLDFDAIGSRLCKNRL